MTSLNNLPDEKDTLIAIYCASGHQGVTVLMMLHLIDHTNVSNLGSGMNAWTAAELPVVE